MRLASPGVNVNSDNGNANSFAVRPVASINCGYTIIDCIRDNIETNHSPILIYMMISINKNR